MHGTVQASYPYIIVKYKWATDPRNQHEETIYILHIHTLKPWTGCIPLLIPCQNRALDVRITLADRIQNGKRQLCIHAIQTRPAILLLTKTCAPLK